MKYYSRHFVKPGDLNPAQRLFGGQLLAWIDEEAAIFAGCQMGTPIVVTKLMSEIDFVSSAFCGDVVEFGFEVVDIGRTSLTIRCEVRNKQTRALILQVERIVFVALDAEGNPTPHKKAGMTLEEAHQATQRELELREQRMAS
ncbi:acyl-CoA thioesterase [Microbulbifer thermotolerans]|uniref:Acyl-CoA thioesterase n=1 Tax=Microbulbifer thermotolerans TaxID=252514 RepID=A0A143HP26_MICTH|nr:hotdog domain-containing protein [Microbulbifer thermotolerans]AMX03246.1 acyl-CoA thioesterase [Microbulbifer thermotolerans]MCX2780894.1 acyl-CoA thioesterase [Microbulbifer thermotolerans]MCX2784252.1 acyl-CoA thioesterase [Microbulbifer thermotolerans]MCX2794329.1 acyl-CoA thioesterase [Microbulbifer thermotolerans]MCX2800977.1 acyl-CoA thioesterase [Microbulbifer thermotolerans]